MDQTHHVRQAGREGIMCGHMLISDEETAD